MKCRFCGYENADDAKFCNKCGKKLYVSDANVKLTVIIAIIVAFAGGVLAGVILNKNANNEKNIDREVVETAEVPSFDVEPATTMPSQITIVTTKATTVAPTTTIPATTVAPTATIAPMTTVAQVMSGPPISSQTIPQTQLVPNVESIYNPGVIIAPTEVVSPTEILAPTDSIGSSERALNVSTTIKQSDTFEDNGGNEVKVTIIRPVVSGIDQDEVDNFNAGIEELDDAIFSEIGTYIDEKETINIKSITFTKAEMTSLSKTFAKITVTGKLTPRSGSSKDMRYRYIFNREDQEVSYEVLWK